MVDGTIAAAFVLVVAVLNLLPVGYELVLSLLVSRGYKLNYTRLVHIAQFMNKFGFFAEYALAAVVLGLILGAIHLHVNIYYPFFRLEGDLSWLSVIGLHVLPSLFLNVNMLFNFYKGSLRWLALLSACLAAAPAATRTCFVARGACRSSMISSVWCLLYRCSGVHTARLAGREARGGSAVEQREQQQRQQHGQSQVL